MIILAQENVPTGVFDWVIQGGLVALLLVIFYGGMKKDPWWVFGWSFRELKVEKDEWKRLALQGTNMAERGVRTTEKIVDQTIDGSGLSEQEKVMVRAARAAQSKGIIR